MATAISGAADTARWAIEYGKLNWRVFPVWPGQKRPLYAGWQKDATTDPAMCQQYWGVSPNRNIGIVCGEAFDAFDIEVEHLPALTAWMDERGYVLPETPVARTGRGGWHIITQPTGVDGTRRLFLDGKHIGELKSRGGFIVVAPSTTDDMYRWLWCPPRMAVSAAPDWLTGLIRHTPAVPIRDPWPHASLSPETDLAPLVVEVSHGDEGNRNQLLHWAANRACDDGVPFSMAQPALLDAFMQTLGPHDIRGEFEHEGRATIASAYRR